MQPVSALPSRTPANDRSAGTRPLTALWRRLAAALATAETRAFGIDPAER